MSFPDGTPLPSVIGGLLPPLFRDIADRFTTAGITETAFAGGTLYSGTLKSVSDDPISLGFGDLELPGITTGLPFRVAHFDDPAGKWHLDLVLDGISLTLKDAHGADFVRESGTTPRRLIRRATDTAVVISGEATVRFARAGEAAPVVLMFVDAAAADPLADTGAVVGLRCTPPHFFLGTSEFGLTLTQILFDFSHKVSPDFVTRLGQPGDWVGFALAEATFYAPPNAIGRGGFSGGVRNLLIGAPRGLQGEFELQWGRAPLDPATFVFTQDGHTAVGASGGGNARLVAITATADDRVQIAAGFAASAPPEGGTIADWQATWRWPDGTETTGDTSAGAVRHGEILRVTPEEHVPGRPVIRHPEISFRFAASGTIPAIEVVTAAGSAANAVHVAGPAAELAALTFRAASGAGAAGSFAWRLGDGAEQTGAQVSLPVGAIAGDQWLTLRESDAAGGVRQARLRVQATAAGPVLIGARGGVVETGAPAAALTPAAVEGTFDLPLFHSGGSYRPLPESARIDATLAEKVEVPDGALALVTIASGAAAPVIEHDRHVRILFEFANGTPLRWGDLRPAAAAGAGSPADLQRQLLDWAANYPGADFLLIGRCDDLGDDALNARLAHDRRDTVLRFLTTVPAGSAQTAIPDARIRGWGEQDGQPAAVTASPLDAEERAAQRLILATDDVTGAALTDRSGWPAARNTAHASEPVRQGFRRVDVHAVGGTPAAAAVRQLRDPGRAPDLRRMLMPGATIAPVPAVTASPEADYRLRLMAGWDKPTGEGWSDLIPSRAEFEFAWSPQDDPLPDLGGKPVDMGTEVLTVYGSWRHEDATGFTRSQLGIRSDGDPEGLVRLDQPNLVAAMALGPMLLSGLDPAGDTIGTGGRIAALAGATAFAQVDLGGGPLVGAGSKAVIKKIEASAEIRDLAAPGDGYKVRLTGDYTTTLHVNTGALGLATAPENPVRIRYRDVGVEFDQSKADFWDKLGLAYPTDAMEIEDPGRWRIDGVLGKLLRAVETALGTGSLWIETRFAFALTIGVVEISEACIRVTFTGASPIPDFSLRGLVARVDIPSTVKGEGRLRIESGGIIKAGVDLEVIPLKLKASAAFAMAQMTTPEPYTFVSLFAKVQFPVGIPLGASGAALHGFIGQTAINGERDVIASDDVVQREIGWWGKKPEDKYRPRKDQHALGLGAVVGTLPDASFSMSAQGMVVVAFPDPEVIFGVEVSLLSVPDKTAKQQGGNQSASIIGLIVIDDTAVSLAALARYEIPKVLSVVAPFAARFPYSGSGIYVRLGSDGQAGRTGEPVTLTLLPSTLNLRAFSYLMIEQDGLPKLGGRPDFSFDGFSVGFGSGAALEWKAGPIRLSASILLLAGLGTNPLLIKAGIFVQGELDLVVVSVGVSGQIVLTYQQGDIWLDGEFCGRVEFLFFTVKGCVRFRIGQPKTADVAPPPAPVASVALIDRGGRIMGEATAGGGALAGRPIFQMTEIDGVMQNTGADPRDNNTVWSDTAPVINFSHYIADAIPAGKQFDPVAQPSGAAWFGSNRLKYAYRLDDVRLLRASDDAVVKGPGGAALDSAWISSPARQPIGGTTPASGAEVQSLKLLDWMPWDWTLPMADGGASAPGDPAGTIGQLCDPLPRPARACLYGADARADGPHRIRIFQETPAPGPYASRFALAGRPAAMIGGVLVQAEALAAVLAGSGGVMLPGQVAALPQPVAGPAGLLAQGYRLPEMQTAEAGGIARRALPWRADLDRAVTRARLMLLVCDGRPPAVGAEPRECFGFGDAPIGQRMAELALPGLMLTAADPARPFEISDRVSTDQQPAVPGADGRPDIRILPPGLVITPSRACARIELHLFRVEPGQTKIVWTDVNGRQDGIGDDGTQAGDWIVRIEPGADIARIEIAAAGKGLHLYRICCLGAAAGETCIDLSALTPDAVRLPAFDHGGARFTALDPAIGFRLHDAVDAGAAPPVRGRDGLPELGFPDKGVEIVLDAPAQAVTLGLASFAGDVLALALDEAGTEVARGILRGGEVGLLHLAPAAAFRRLIVSGGANESMLFRLCRVEAGAEDASLPVVQSGQGRGAPRWPGRVTGSVAAPGGGACRIVVYDQPASLPEIGDLTITAGPGQRVTLLSLCAVDAAAEAARAQDAEAQAALRAKLTLIASGGLAKIKRVIALEPGQDYRIEVDWSWQSWTANAAGTDSPASPPAGAWKAGGTQVFRFRTAEAQMGGGETQDGLNEYLFDARDLARYLRRVEPADGRDTVFTDDPLWMHFDTGHVEELAASYGRRLELQVRRTDPPPQPDAPAMAAAVWPELVETVRATGLATLLTPAEQRINEAAAAAPCLPGGPVRGGVSLGGRYRLAPRAMYDLNLIAPRTSGTEPAPVVHATRFVTSRHAGPGPMIESLGFALTGTAPIPPDEMIVPETAALPAGAATVSDADLGAALAAIGADTLPLPGDAGRVILLWQALAAGGFGIAGVLIDAPEPLRRMAAVVEAGQAVDRLRCAPDRLVLDGTSFLPLRATLNWTRVLFIPPAPVVPAAGAVLSMLMTVNPGGALTGRRVVTQRPMLLYTEGF